MLDGREFLFDAQIVGSRGTRCRERKKRARDEKADPHSFILDFNSERSLNLLLKAVHKGRSRDQESYNRIDMNTMARGIGTISIAAFCMTGLLNAKDESGAAKRLQESANVLTEIMDAKDKAIPQDLLDKATCIVIVPGLKKGAFIVGGKFGKGFISCRGKNNVGWGAPAAIRVEGGSLGFQIGGSETDAIMLVLNQRGMEKLLSSKFTLGADASVAAGPVGRTTSAETDALMRAEILTWSRSRGAFAGVALDGATLRQDLDTNKEMYGKLIENKDIVEKRVPVPKMAAPLIARLNKYSSRK